MQPLRSASILATALVASFSGCKQRGFESGSHAESLSYQCSRGVRLLDFIGRNQSCYRLDAVEKDAALSVGSERKLPPFIPCNRIEHISEASDRQFNNTSYINWLKTAPALSQKSLDAIFETPEMQPPEFASHPLLKSPSHTAILSVIRNARHTLFIDVMLFGGVWGAEIIREMLVANRERGVDIVFLRDSKNIFWFKPEIEPVWARMIHAGAKMPGVLALRSETAHRLGELPFLLNVFSQLEGSLRSFGGDLSGTSDHSKILIADGFDDNATAYVTSKNFSDFNYINYDEGVIIHGPAAALLQTTYMHDLTLAMELAQNERPGNGEPALQKDDMEQFRRWQNLAKRALAAGSEGETRFPARGSAGVRIIENNADNTVRTVEHGVFTLIASARKSVRIYNFLAFNPMMAKALIDAEKRLGEGNVRMLVDTADSYPGNQVQIYGLQTMRSRDARTPLSTLARWRKTIELIPKAQIPGGVDIGQEQHVKSIIVDDKYYLAGSANFDILTLGGAFRETSVIVDDPSTAQKATAIFDSIWNDPHQITTSEILAKDFPKSTFDEKTNRFLFEGLLDEQRRIRALNPRNIIPDETCMR